LFVVGNTKLSSGDSAIQSRLQALRASVVVRAATAVQSSDASGKALVVISDSVNSSDVNTKFRDTTVPVLCLENGLFDDMRLTGTTSGADFGTITGQTEVTLLAVAHPIAAGLNVPVVTSAQTFAWGVPAAGATKIATVAGNDSRAAVFAYESGSNMVGGTAPARRVGFFATGAASSVFTAQGGKLFDNAVQWLTPAACSAGFHSCGGTCVSNSSASSCGASCTVCPVPANGTATCDGSVCGVTCATGFHSCGGACVNISASSCGASCTVCPVPANGTATCDGSLCGIVCNVGYKSCNGTCILGTGAC
jgi:hypothetical protein